MELKEAIQKRRSIRKYSDKYVPDEIIEDLIECARLSPSAKNRQPWFFVVVREEIKNDIANIMISNIEKMGTITDKDDQRRYCSVIPTARVIESSPVLILVFSNVDANWIIGDTLSIGSAIEHICLRATDLGLGSLWIRDTAYTNKEISELLGYIDKELVSVVAIGYKNEEPDMRKRKELSEILVFKNVK